jgi:hypothetical protein
VTLITHLTKVAFFLLINASRTLVDFSQDLSDIQRRLGKRPDLKTIKRIPIPSDKGKGKSKGDADSALPYFSELRPPIPRSKIEASFAKLKAAMTLTKDALRASDDIEYRMLGCFTLSITRDFNFGIMSLLVERYYGSKLRTQLMATGGGASVRNQLIILLSQCTITGYDAPADAERPEYCFWDRLSGNDEVQKEAQYLSFAERQRLVAVDSIRKSAAEFNQRVINLVEKNKYGRIQFDTRGSLDGGVRAALDELTWVGNSFNGCGLNS